MIYAIAASSLNLILGYGGMVSFGHAAFLGAGAYAVGILMAEGVTSAWIAWPVAVALAALFALVIGAISLRTRGVYFIMITLAFAQMMYYIFISMKAYGGDDGLQPRRRARVGSRPEPEGRRRPSTTSCSRFSPPRSTACTGWCRPGSGA